MVYKDNAKVSRGAAAFDEYLEIAMRADGMEPGPEAGVDFQREFVDAGRYNEAIRAGGDVEVDPEQLRMGIEVEYEHTTNESVARRIALDHLAEIPDYYTRLKRMEEEAGVGH